MPYQGEYANKASHSDIVKDPDVEKFLQKCNYLKPPSDEEGKTITSGFEKAPNIEHINLPKQIISIDGSEYSSAISDRLPSTEIGYVKVSSILIDMADFKGLRIGRYIDPFKVAKLQNNHDALKFVLPSTNICYKGKKSVRDSFRVAIDDYFSSEKTWINPKDLQSSLRTTLFHLASKRPGNMGTGSPQSLKIHKCPDCEQEKIEVYDIPEAQYCPNCKTEIYPSDCLRLWEEVNELQSNRSVMLRFMQIVEHLMPIHYVRFLVENSLSALGSIAFFIDRPLGIFGTGAWLHGSIMRYLSEVNESLAKINKSPILIIGLQKTGQVVDHVNLIDRFIEPNTIFPINDDYRYLRIVPGRKASQSGFGTETYYGQDFIYKTPNKRTFVFALPYPFSSKESSNFVKAKIEINHYQNLSLALALINNFECDLYENAIIPIALANRYTAISLVPGGRVLDLLTQESLSKKH